MIDLVSSRLQMSVSPEEGGSITRLLGLIRGGWHPILLADPDPTDGPQAFAAALFPMLPFANRAARNQLGSGSRSYPVVPNTSGPHAIHGTGWERPWQVLEQTRQRVKLGLDVDAQTYPFSFSAALTLELSDTALLIGCRITNTDHRDIPAGLGFHPYFPRTPATRLQFAARWFWLEGPDHLPTSPISIPPELDFKDGATVPESWRNNLYSGWSGHAEVHQPDLGYRLILESSGTLRELMLYTPPGAARFALEPQSHSSGFAFEADLLAPATGLLCLAPGQNLSGTFSITLHSA